MNFQVMLCCGDSAYDPSRFRCLPNNVTQAIPSDNANPGVCGDAIIDLSRQVCCRGRPQERRTGITLCCGSNTYNAITEVCCEGTVLPDPRDGSQCCGRRLYQPADQVCCNGNLVTRPDTTFPFSLPFPGYQCCGQELITNPNNQLCCNGIARRDFGSSGERKQYRCCGNEAYNFRNQTCCEGRIVDGFNVRCCGDVGFDDNRQTCCNNQLFPTGRVPQELCCGPSNPYA